eukprot:312642_1
MSDLEKARSLLERCFLITDRVQFATEIVDSVQIVYDECLRKIDLKNELKNETSESSSFTKLMTLVRKGNSKKVKSHSRLLKSGRYAATGKNGDASGTVNAQSNEGQTALIIAASQGNTDMAEILLEGSADPNIVNNRGESALTHAAYAANLELVELLLSHKARVDIGHPVVAATHINSFAVVTALLDAGASANEVKSFGTEPHSALSTACSQGQVEICELLLERGADPSDPGSSCPALFQCFHLLLSKRFTSQPISLLLVHGADPNRRWKDKSIFSVAFHDVFKTANEIDKSTQKQVESSEAIFAEEIKNEERLRRVLSRSLKNARTCAMLLSSFGAVDISTEEVTAGENRSRAVGGNAEQSNVLNAAINDFEAEISATVDDPLQVEPVYDWVQQCQWHGDGPCVMHVVDNLDTACRIGRASWLRKQVERQLKSAKRRRKRERQRANRSMNGENKQRPNATESVVSKRSQKQESDAVCSSDLPVTSKAKSQPIDKDSKKIVTASRLPVTKSPQALPNAVHNEVPAVDNAPSQPSPEEVTLSAEELRRDEVRREKIVMDLLVEESESARKAEERKLKRREKRRARKKVMQVKKHEAKKRADRDRQLKREEEKRRKVQQLEQQRERERQKLLQKQLETVELGEPTPKPKSETKANPKTTAKQGSKPQAAQRSQSTQAKLNGSNHHYHPSKSESIHTCRSEEKEDDEICDVITQSTKKVTKADRKPKPDRATKKRRRHSVETKPLKYRDETKPLKSREGSESAADPIVMIPASFQFAPVVRSDNAFEMLLEGNGSFSVSESSSGRLSNSTQSSSCRSSPESRPSKPPAHPKAKANQATKASPKARASQAMKASPRSMKASHATKARANYRFKPTDLDSLTVQRNYEGGRSW